LGVPFHYWDWFLRHIQEGSIITKDKRDIQVIIFLKSKGAITDKGVVTELGWKLHNQLLQLQEQFRKGVSYDTMINSMGITVNPYHVPWFLKLGLDPRITGTDILLNKHMVITGIRKSPDSKNSNTHPIPEIILDELAEMIKIIESSQMIGPVRPFAIQKKSMVGPGIIWLRDQERRSKIAILDYYYDLVMNHWRGVARNFQPYIGLYGGQLLVFKREGNVGKKAKSLSMSAFDGIMAIIRECHPDLENGWIPLDENI
jgi:hypothetical protein